MKRRSLLQGAAAAALGAPALSGLAQQAVTLKFHTLMAPQTKGWRASPKRGRETGVRFTAGPTMSVA
jgi:hypothetical protein